MARWNFKRTQLFSSWDGPLFKFTCNSNRRCMCMRNLISINLYYDFLDRGLLLKRKLLIQGHIVVKLISLLKMCYDFVNPFGIYVSEINTDMPRCDHNVVLSSFISYHWIHNKNNTTVVHSGAETIYYVWASEFAPVFPLLVPLGFVLFNRFKFNVFTPFFGLVGSIVISSL